MIYYRRSIGRRHRKETMENVIHRCNRLTQCFLSGLYHLLNIYSIHLHEAHFTKRIHLCISLLFFVISLFNIDKKALSKALPALDRSFDNLIGLKEAVFVLMAINWMFIFLSWVLYFPLHHHQNNNVCFFNFIPISLTIISSLNWCSWTISFIY